MSKRIGEEEIKEMFNKTTHVFEAIDAGQEIKFEFKHTVPLPVLGFRKGCGCIADVDIKKGVIKGTMKPEPNAYEIKAAGSGGLVSYSRSLTIEFDDGSFTEIASDKEENKGELIKNIERTRQVLIITGAVRV